VPLLAEVGGRHADEVEVGIERHTDTFDDSRDPQHQCEVRWQAERKLVHRVLDLLDNLLDAVLLDVLPAGVGDGELHHVAHHFPVGLRGERSHLDECVEDRVDVLAGDRAVELYDPVLDKRVDVAAHAEVVEHECPVVRDREVPRVRIGVEDTVGDDHLEVGALEAFGQPRPVQPQVVDLLQVGDFRPADVLHRQDAVGRVGVDD